VGYVILICYLIQLPLSYYAAFKAPRLPGNEKTERGRKLIVVVGLLPCGPLSVFAQLIYLGVYMAWVKTAQGSSRRAQEGFERSLGNSAPGSGGNPFGTISTPSAPAGPNPFGGPVQASPSQSARPADNPFSAEPAAEPRPPASSDDNPFG
jgi:hypothetical protein